MTITTGATRIHSLGPATVDIPREQVRRLLTDLAERTYTDRENNDNPIYDDAVLLDLIPRYCGDIDPQLAVALFLLMAEEQADQSRADATYQQIDIAERNAGHYLDALLGVRP